jgi:hypothetical protein
MGVFVMTALTTTGIAEELEAPLVPAEKITYAIKKYGVQAGEATLEFFGLTSLQSRSVLLIKFRATGLNFLDEETISLDPETYLPIQVDRDLNIFGKKEKIVEQYDQQKGRVRIVKTAGGKKTERTINKGDRIDNIYCFIYRYRTTGLFRMGEKLSLKLPTRDVVIALVGKNRMKSDGKTHDAFFMQSQPKKYSLWFDSGPRKIPLRIDGAVGIGNTSMIMTNHEMSETVSE